MFIHCLGIGLKCLERGVTDLSESVEVVDCKPGYDTCIEALGIKMGKRTFQGCAGTNTGFKGFAFDLNYNDVKANGCMSREEIEKKLKKREIHGDIDNIKICFCNNGECCNQNIPQKGSAQSGKCPEKETKKPDGVDKLHGAASGVMDNLAGAAAAAISSGVTIKVSTGINSKFLTKLVLFGFQLQIMNLVVKHSFQL